MLRDMRGAGMGNGRTDNIIHCMIFFNCRKFSKIKSLKKNPMNPQLRKQHVLHLALSASDRRFMTPGLQCPYFLLCHLCRGGVGCLFV